jgi:hypothetical protein
MAKQRYGLNEDSNTPYEDRTMKRAWTTFDANHIKEIIVELYSWMILQVVSNLLYLYGLYCQDENLVFSKTARYFAKPMTAKRTSLLQGW